jgi:alpha-mannosidase
MQKGLLLVASLFVACAAFGQSATPARELNNLSPAALAKLRTLESLNSLPADEWRYHAGDLAHGESPTLDDSAWPIVTPSSKAPHEAVWYRRTIEVPRTLHGYDLTGARIWFQFVSKGNGPTPEIVYFNGRRVALGDDLEPIVLFEPAHPGDKVLIAVKILATVDDKTFRGATLRIDPDPASTRPHPDDVRQQIITAADMLPALTPSRKDLLATVESAAAAIDLAALDRADQNAFDASLRAAQQKLDALHAALSTAHITLAGNAHIDAAWLWPRSETIDVVHLTFTTAIQLMNEYPDYTYTQSAAQYSAWIADKYPELNAQIAQRIKEGRWEIVGGMWVEPDLNLPGGESLVRQLLIGQRTFHDLYGVTARIGWNPDSFGYNWQLPQIYKRAGLDYFVTQKMHWNDTNQLPFRLFWWQSPDGSKVLTYFPTDYVHLNVNPTRIAADFAESAARNPGATQMLDLYGVGDHGGGPTRDMLDQADHWIAAGNAGAALPTERYGTAQSFFSSVEKNLNPDSPVWNYDSIARGYTLPPASSTGALGIPTWNDELYFEYHRGVYTTQAKQKANMRRSEAETLTAEKLASLAWLDGATYPAADLTEDWKKITFNQFHDLAAGSGIAVIYRDAQDDFSQVFRSDREISASALTTIAAHIDTRPAHIDTRAGSPDTNGVPVLVFNPLAWSRSETVELHVQFPEAAMGLDISDGSGKPAPFQIINSNKATNEYTLLVRVNDIPALGYRVITVHSTSPADPIVKPAVAGVEGESSILLSNAQVGVLIDRRTGCITSLKSNGIEYLAPNACGNQLQTWADNPKQYDAWNIDPGTLDGPMTPIATVDSVALVTDGPLRKTVRITRHWQSSKFTQDISLDAYDDFVRISTGVDWHETHTLLKAAFPLAATGPKATFEIPFGSIQRPTTRDNSFTKAQFEVPALRWADLGNATQGVSILNDSKYGYDALGNTLRLTLLRSPTWPDPDADRGPQHFTYEIYPHAGPWQQALTLHRAYELNDPLTATQVMPHAGSLPPAHSFVSVDAPNVTLTAVKKAEDSNALVFRMYEWAGTAADVKLHVPPGAAYATASNLMETPEGPRLPLTRAAGAPAVSAGRPGADSSAMASSGAGPNATAGATSAAGAQNSDTLTVPIHPYEILTVQVAYPPMSTAAK